MSELTFPIRLRATRLNPGLQVKALIQHPMESGNALDAAGKTVPAHYITEVSVWINGALRVRAALGPGVSRNPLLGWRFSDGQLGDEVVLAWEDNLGFGGRQVATVG